MCSAKLSIPKQDPSRELGIPQSTQALQQWLDGLPVADAEKSTMMVLQLLASSNRCDLNLEFRLQLLKSLVPITDHLVQSLRSKYQMGESPYSSARNIKRIEAVKALLQELGYGFKILITKLSAKEDKESLQYLSSAIFHTVRINACRLVESYSLYEPVVNDIWGELSLLYRFSLKRGLNSDRHLLVDQESSIEQLYMQVLLLSAVNPYRLMRGEAQKIFKLMGQWAHHAKLKQPEPGWQPKAAEWELVVNLNKGEPPFTLSTSKPAENLSELRIVDVSEVKRYLNEFANQAHQQGRGNAAKELSLRLQMDMMKRLIGGWKSDVDRESERFLRQEDIELVMGLSDCHSLFRHEHNDPNDFNLDDFGLVPLDSHWGSAPKKKVVDDNSVFKIDDPHHDIWEDKNTIVTSGDLEDMPEAPKLETYRAKQVDVSSGGMGIEFALSSRLHAKVGDLLCVRIALEGAPWRLGDVRWQQALSSAQGSMGVRILSDKPIAVSCKALEGLGSGSADQKGLLIHADDLHDPQAELIVPASIYDVNTLLQVKIEKERTKIVLQEKLETTASFARYRFKLR